MSHGGNVCPRSDSSRELNMSLPQKITIMSLFHREKVILVSEGLSPILVMKMSGNYRNITYIKCHQLKKCWF